MNNQNLNTEPAPANAVRLSSTAVRDFAAEKARAVATLAEIRRRWRALVHRGVSPDVLAGFKGGVSIALRHLEMATPEWELWTTLPDEVELTANPASATTWPLPAGCWDSRCEKMPPRNHRKNDKPEHNFRDGIWPNTCYCSQIAATHAQYLWE